MKTPTPDYRVRWLARALAFTQLGASLVSCAQPGFECGREVPGKPGTFRRCDRSNEVCICYTNSCAVAVPKEDPNTPIDAGSAEPTYCTSGYRYVKQPFASKDVAGQCVEQWQLELSGDAGKLDQAKGQLMCPGAPQTPQPDDPTTSGTPDSGGSSVSQPDSDIPKDAAFPDGAQTQTSASPVSSASDANASTGSSSNLADAEVVSSNSGESMASATGMSAITGDSLGSASNVTSQTGDDASVGSSL